MRTIRRYTTPRFGTGDGRRSAFDRSTAGWLQNIRAARRYKKNATHGEAVPGEITPTLREPGALEFDVGKTQ